MDRSSHLNLICWNIRYFQCASLFIGCIFVGSETSLFMIRHFVSHVFVTRQSTAETAHNYSPAIYSIINLASFHAIRPKLNESVYKKDEAFISLIKACELFTCFF